MSRESARSYFLYLHSLLVILFPNKIVLVILCNALLVIMMRCQIRDKLQYYYYVVRLFCSLHTLFDPNRLGSVLKVNFNSSNTLYKMDPIRSK